MAEQKQRLIRLGRGYNGFYCAETRFHLMGGMKPQDVYPADRPLSDAIKRGLRGGTLVDVNRVIPLEELLTPKQLAKFKAQSQEQAPTEVVPTQEVKPQESTQVEDKGEEAPEGDAQDNVSDDTTDNADSTDAVVLSAEEIEAKTKGELLDLIKEQDLSLDELGLNSRSNASEVKAALNKHFGHTE